MPALFADLSIAGIPLAFLSIALIVELTPGPTWRISPPWRSPRDDAQASDAAPMTMLRRVLGAGPVVVAFWLFWSTAENRPA